MLSSGGIVFVGTLFFVGGLAIFAADFFLGGLSFFKRCLFCSVGFIFFCGGLGLFFFEGVVFLLGHSFFVAALDFGGTLFLTSASCMDPLFHSLGFVLPFFFEVAFSTCIGYRDKLDQRNQCPVYWSLRQLDPAIRCVRSEE